MHNMTRISELDDAYFFVDNNHYVAYVPLGMIASLHAVPCENGLYDDDGYHDVVLTTVSGREYVTQGFSSLKAAMDFCEEQMGEIAAYRKALAVAGKS